MFSRNPFSTHRPLLLSIILTSAVIFPDLLAQSVVSVKRSDDSSKGSTISSEDSDRVIAFVDVLHGSVFSSAYKIFNASASITPNTLLVLKVSNFPVSDLLSEKPYEKIGRENLTKSIKKNYPDLPAELQTRLLNIYVDIDNRFAETQNQISSRSTNKDDDLALALARTRLLHRVLRFEIEATIEQGSDPILMKSGPNTNGLIHAVEGFESDIGTMMIRGSN